MRWMPLVLLASLLAAALPAEADAQDCNEPCGWIVPNIDLEFPDKLLCGGGRLIYADEPPTDCYPLMAVGESRVLEGTLRVYWDAQEEPTYPMHPDEPIVVTMSGTGSNPKWLDVKVDPSEVVIGIEELYNLDNYVVQPEESPILWFEYVIDITVTVTRTGDPTQADVDRMADRQGVIPVFIKARSSESGAYYREAFGIEEFRFQGVADPEVAREIAEATAMPATEEAPGLAPVAVLALLGAVLLVRRRRR